ncbi:MAG: tetratricopeptide repeat protein, partial [Candidatus Goldbacteria bacterium]|nr:tetratricopeptide repeat protein [Candidatus Goldiibacteriota bacterium]
KLGELHFEKGEKEQALEYYKKIVDIYFKNRLYKKALPIYQKILEITPDDISAREKIAEIYEREGNESDGKREYLFLAEYYWKQKNIEKTDFYAQKAIEFKSIEAHFFKGAALFAKKEIGEAKKEIEMLLKFKSNHIAALNILSVIYTELGQIEDAMATLDKVIKIEQENIDAYVNLANLYIKKNNNKEAINKYLIAVNICHSKQMHERAKEILEQALILDPKNIDILSKLADTYVKMNRKREAADTYLKISGIYKEANMSDKQEEYYKMAADIDPGHPEVIQHAKKVAEDVKTLKPSVQPVIEVSEKPVVEQSIKQSPQEKAKIFHSYFDQMDSVKPVDLTPSKPKIEKKISQEPVIDKLPEVEKDVPIFKPMEKEEETQKEHIRQKMFVSPQPAAEDDVPALIAMGDNYVKIGSFDEAIEMYQRAFALEPNNQQIKKKLTDLYSKYAGTSVSGHINEETRKKAEEEARKKVEEARKKVEEARKKAEEEARKKAEEEARKKAEEEARKKAEEEARKKAEEEARKKAEEEARKKAEEEKKKREEEAKRKAEGEKIKSEDESVDIEISDDFITVTTAEIFMRQGIFTEAEKILKKIIKQDPSNIEAKMKLDELLKMIEETEQKGVNIQDEDIKKGPQSKVTYI